MTLSASLFHTRPHFLFFFKKKKQSEICFSVQKISSFEHINALHLDPETGRYFDWGNHSDGVELVKIPQKKLVGYAQGKPQYEAVQVIKRSEDPNSKPK